MDFQFYPTPVHLAKLVWEKFKNPIKLVLDPQAGKGDLTFSYINNFASNEFEDQQISSHRSSRYCRANVIHWHACEINHEMHAILKERDAVVVGHDFLKMQNGAQYSHIVGNPPFNDGANHLLHAWNIAYGAEICFILNAETIRNPYCAERKRVLELIEKYGSVEFHANQFLGEGVERETAVEVAIVYLEKVPDVVLDMDAVINGLRTAQSPKIPDQEPTLTALALPVDFIDRVVEDHDTAINASIAYAQAKAVMLVSENRLGFTFADMQSKGLTGRDRPTQVDAQEVIRVCIQELANALRERAWGQILRSTKLMDHLSTAGRKNVESQFQSISKLEFSKTNVHGFFAGILQSMGDINSQMILDLFDSILQRDNDNATFYQSWKSNEKHKALGMRIKRTRFILPLNQYVWDSKKRASHGMLSVLSDIDKVFRMLDGKPSVPVRDTNGGLIDNGLCACFENGLKFVNLVHGQKEETEYFCVRYYPGKGTVHFFPKNMDVIERMNRFVGKARQWLPPEMEKSDNDFVKQYEQAEKLTPDYLAEFKKKSRYYRSPVYAILKEVDSQEHSDYLLELAEQVSEVQAKHGIHVQDAISYEAPDVSQVVVEDEVLDLIPIGYAPVAAEQRQLALAM